MDDLDAYLTLWTAVIERAMLDVTGSVRHERDTALMWIMSDEIDVGSFVWVCDMLGVCVEARQQIRRVCDVG